MSENEVREQVRTIVGRMAPGADVTPAPGDRLIEDLGYDSMAIIELALELEQQLGLRRIEEDEAMDVVTVGHLEELVLGVLQVGEGTS